MAFDRGERRHHLQRMKAKAKRFSEVNRLPPECYATLYDHLAHCSGPCCGNPRRWFGEATIQERRTGQVAAMSYASPEAPRTERPKRSLRSGNVPEGSGFG